MLVLFAQQLGTVVSMPEAVSCPATLPVGLASWTHWLHPFAPAQYQVTSRLLFESGQSEGMDETEKNAYKAKLAEQAERYEGKANRRGKRADSDL